MTSHFSRAVLVLVTTLSAIGCSRFVWKEDPFTPDQAPTSEIIASGTDTTYVFRAPSYYLLAPRRSALWNREVLDDVAWRYRSLFGEAPPAIAIKLDSVAAPGSTDSTWRGVPFASVAPRRRAPTTDAKAREEREEREERERREAEDSIRARLVMAPMLAATAAGSWLEARARRLRGTDSKPGGPERAALETGALPAWMEAGALRILASGGAPDRAGAELRANQKAIVPLASLFAVAWQRRPNAMEIARPGIDRFDEDGDMRFVEGVPHNRQRRESIAGVSPTFVSQSVSLLAFMHERDAGLVARLADELPRGASVETVLASSKTLPHDVPGLEAEWRKWLQRSAKRR